MFGLSLQINRLGLRGVLLLNTLEGLSKQASFLLPQSLLPAYSQQISLVKHVLYPIFYDLIFASVIFGCRRDRIFSLGIAEYELIAINLVRESHILTFPVDFVITGVVVMLKL